MDKNFIAGSDIHHSPGLVHRSSSSMLEAISIILNGDVNARQVSHDANARPLNSNIGYSRTCCSNSSTQ